MATLKKSNGIMTSFRLNGLRAQLSTVVKGSLAKLEKEIGPQDIQIEHDAVMDVFEYLRSLSIGTNERLILSKPNLSIYLLLKALDKGKKITDVGGVAHLMVRYAGYLVFGKSSKDVIPNLAQLCVEKVLKMNLLQTELIEGKDKLDLIYETVQHLKGKHIDFTNKEVAKNIINAYKKIIKYGFLPRYVDAYLEEINATDEQKTPEFRQSMIQYLLDTGLNPSQYGSSEDPWTDDLNIASVEIKEDVDEDLKELKIAVGADVDKKVEAAKSSVSTELETMGQTLAETKEKIIAINKRLDDIDNIPINEQLFPLNEVLAVYNTRFEQLNAKVKELSERRIINTHDFDGMTKKQVTTIHKIDIHTLADVLKKEAEFKSTLINEGVKEEVVNAWVDDTRSMIHCPLEDLDNRPPVID